MRSWLCAPWRWWRRGKLSAVWCMAADALTVQGCLVCAHCGTRDLKTMIAAGCKPGVLTQAIVSYGSRSLLAPRPEALTQASGS
jgi:hypothetical protein